MLDCRSATSSGWGQPLQREIKLLSEGLIQPLFSVLWLFWLALLAID